MKLSLGLAAALSGFTAAAQQAADVYLLPAPESAPMMSVSPSLARLLFLQRLAPFGKGPSSHDIPDNLDVQSVLSFINDYGKDAPSLFAQDGRAAPSQLVVMLEGMTEKQIKDTGAAFHMQPAFTIANPPSSSALGNLIKYDFYNAGVTNEHSCGIEQVVNPFEKKCWSGKSTVARYNVQEDAEVLGSLLEKFTKLVKLANSGEMETTVVLLPDSASSSSWSEKSQELRRRQAETVMSALDETVAVEEPAAPTTPANDDPIFYPPRGSIPSCFKSKDSCASATKNCSSHGNCLNRYANDDGSDGKEICYTCHCLATESKSGSVTHWAGAACSKKDLTVQFWLFAGFTLALVGILSISITMLFNVGEEKLPGVIGAGVSRNN